jgi:hypothetical protein
MGITIIPPGAPVAQTGASAAAGQQYQVGGTPVSATAAANTAVVVTVPATAGKSNRINSLSVAYSAAPTAGLLTIVVNGVTIFQLAITASGPTAVPLPDGGLLCAAGFAATITLAAAGAAVVGQVNTSFIVE